MANRPDDREPLAAVFGPTAKCLAVEDLEKLLEPGSAHPHLDECPHCRAELANLRMFLSAQTEPQEAADLAAIAARLERRTRDMPAAPEKTGRLKRWFSLPAMPMPRVALASLAGIAILGAVLWQMRPEPPATGGGAGPVYRSGAIRVVEPAGDSGDRLVRLRWEPVPQAVRYSVRLMEVDRTTFFSTDTPQTMVELPAMVQSKISPPKTLLWEVVATDASGRVIASTDILTFRAASEK